MPLEDDVFPNEEQPLPAAVSPTVDSPGYITKSDPKEDPKEEEDDEDLERNLDIYLMTKADVLEFEKLVNVSRAKKLEKSHDPLALVAYTGSSSRNTSSYYVTHSTSVVDYKDGYQQDDVHTNSEDPLASAMLLLARAITRKFSTLTNNRLRTSSNTRNQSIIQGDMVNIQSMNSSNAGRNNRRAYVQEEIIEGSNAPNETRNDEVGVILTDEQNDFLFVDASRIKEIEELTQSQTLSVPEQQYQLYISMKNDPQLQQQDIAIWLALQMKFENLQVPQTTCRTSVVRPRDQDDPHDDAHPEGENSTKRQNTSEYEAYVSGESSSGQVNEEE
ncbi:hypothetical protein Tco_0411222 [Tanacetum coccineum]